MLTNIHKQLIGHYFSKFTFGLHYGMNVHFSLIVALFSPTEHPVSHRNMPHYYGNLVPLEVKPKNKVV